MDFVDKQHIARLEICKNRNEIALSLDGRTARDAQVDAHLGGNNLRQRGFTETRRTVQQHVIERLTTIQRRSNEDAEVVLYALLTDILVQGARPQALLGGNIVILTYVWGYQPLVLLRFSRYG